MGIGVAVLGLGGTAAAGGLLPFDWPSAAGRTCSIVGATAELAGGTDNESRDGVAATTADERNRTLQEARRFLADYDFAAVDRGTAVDRYLAEQSAAMAGQPDPAEQAPGMTGDELEVAALVRQQARDLVTHLEAAGYRSDVIALTQGYTGGSQPGGEFRCAE
jgi:hypothetical protein